MTTPHVLGPARLADLARRAALPNVSVEVRCACTCRCHGSMTAPRVLACNRVIAEGQVDCEWECRTDLYRCTPFVVPGKPRP